MATYFELVDSVLQWSNRDTGVLSHRQVKQLIDYANDEAYRTLRILPMEEVVAYNPLTQDDVDDLGSLIIPADLTEFIQLRRRNPQGSNRYPETYFDVYSSRADIRSFFENGFRLHGDEYFYTREENKLLVFPCEVGDVFEIFYYKRLPAPYARYSITLDNANAGLLTTVDPLNGAENDYGINVPSIDLSAANPDAIAQAIINSDQNDFTASSGIVYGTESPNWLRDQNEKVLLFGALAEAFDYLDEMEQSQKFRQKFNDEILKLNHEEKTRMGSGGNLQVRYYSDLL